MTSQRKWLNPLLWAIGLVLVNALWFNVAEQAAPNEINTADQFQTYREVEVGAVFGTEGSIPAAFSAQFSGSDVDDVNVSYAVLLENETVVFSWSGTVNDKPPEWTGDLAPGTYVVQTEVEEGVEVEQMLSLKPFKSIQASGHVVLSALLVVIAGAEQLVKKTIASKAAPSDAQVPPNTPFKAVNYTEQDSLDWSEQDSPWREPIR